MRFNPPPNWPAPPPGFQPGPDWTAPPEWGPPPPGWQLWIDDGPAPRPARSAQSSARPLSAAPASPQSPASSRPQQPVSDAASSDAASYGIHPESGPANPRGKKKSRISRAGKKAVEHPLWTTLGAIIGIIGLVISAYQIYQTTKTPPVELEISSITLDGQQSVGAKIFAGPDGTAGTDGSIELTPIDITMQNKGGEPSLITRIDAEVVFFQQLQDCTGTRPSPDRINGGYQIAIPMRDAQPAEKSIGTEIRFEVKPDAADRMVFTIGPDTQAAFATTPMVMSVKLTFVHDDDQRKEVGTVSLVTTVAAANAQISGTASTPAGKQCAKDNLTHLDTMFAIQANRSRLLDSLRSAYQSAAA